MATFGNPSDVQIAQQLNSRGITSPLVPYIAQMRALAAQYNVPITIVLAHLAMESGYGTDDNALTRVYNYWGLKGSGSRGTVTIQTAGGPMTFAAFGSVQEGMQAAIANVSRGGYVGLTLRQYLAYYLTGDPSGGTDGAGNYTSDYLNAALGIIRKFGGDATADTVVIPGTRTLNDPTPQPGPAPSPAPGDAPPYGGGISNPVDGIGAAVQGGIQDFLNGLAARFASYWTRDRVIRIAVVLIGAVLLVEGFLAVASPAVGSTVKAVVDA